jgi:carbohydrate-binding DOMON domain-containing protein
MKKIIILLVLILVYSSCSSKLKSIDRKVSKIEKIIEKNPNLGQNICWNYSSRTGQIIYFTKSENQIKKINFEIDLKNDCKEYSKKCTIYLENNIPILITEIVNGVCEYEMSGINKKTNKFQSFNEESKISSNIRIYIDNWEEFEFTVIGGYYERNMKVKQKYDELITEVLKENMK